jgi:transcriptional regulator with XRE-family HTH domain
VENNLRDVRESKRLTIRDLESATGISKSHLSEIENGIRKPTPEERLKLESHFGVGVIRYWYRIPADPDL